VVALATPACPPTRPAAIGPEYVPGAPARSVVGNGHVLYGVVRAAYRCRPIAHARVEVWQAGPDGRYGRRWRATMFTDRAGRYRFQSPYPGRVGSLRPHIHLRVSAPGYATLVAEYRPRPHERLGRFDISLLLPP
jgi:hypothetical protein